MQKRKGPGLSFILLQSLFLLAFSIDIHLLSNNMWVLLEALIALIPVSYLFIQTKESLSKLSE